MQEGEVLVDDCDRSTYPSPVGFQTGHIMPDPQPLVYVTTIHDAMSALHAESCGR